MSELPNPATAVEMYLAAILAELQAIRASLAGAPKPQEPGPEAVLQEPRAQQRRDDRRRS